MKTPRLIPLIVLLTGIGIAPLAVRADTAYSFRISVTSAQDFYQPLAAHGYWVDLRDYGRCWYPAYVASDWHPYTDGHWEWTDEGWYWVSDEPWAWATYHYGRWLYDPYYGWVWVPDTEWAPAWVSWREGGDYIGWAPLPPNCTYGPTGVLVIREVVWWPRAFVFVPQRRFCDRVRPHTVIRHHTTIVNQTVNITNIHRDDRRHRANVRDNGPAVSRVERNASRRIEQASAADLWRENSARSLRYSEERRVARPPVRRQDASEEISRTENSRRADRAEVRQPVTSTPAFDPSERREPDRTRSLPEVIRPQPETRSERPDWSRNRERFLDRSENNRSPRQERKNDSRPDWQSSSVRRPVESVPAPVPSPTPSPSRSSNSWQERMRQYQEQAATRRASEQERASVRTSETRPEVNVRPTESRSSGNSWRDESAQSRLEAWKQSRDREDNGRGRDWRSSRRGRED